MHVFHEIQYLKNLKCSCRDKINMRNNLEQLSTEQQYGLNYKSRRRSGRGQMSVGWGGLGRLRQEFCWMSEVG